MKWQCALLQRWLPEYPDGELPGWGKRWLKAHVASCAACRQEAAELREVVTAVQATPGPDPGAEFWQAFSREVHLKLAQTAPEGRAASTPSSSRWFRLPYLLGAPVLAGFLLWVAVQLTGSGGLLPNQALVKPKAPVQMAAMPRRAPEPPRAFVPRVPVRELEQFVPVALETGGTLPEEEVDISGWDLDSELAGMTDQEKEIFLKKLHQRAKDGSCADKLSSFFWA